MLNWIADTNDFGLESPPDWWLQQLLDFDRALVLLPSRKNPEYLLARRRELTAGLGDVAMLDNKQPDTNMCYQHHVLPIAPLKWKANVARVWTQGALDSLLADLRSRDAWALGGGPGGNPDAAWMAVEANEAAEKRHDRAALRDKFYHMGRDAYRSLKARTGQRNKRASDYHGVARPTTATGTGRIIIP